MDVPIIKETNMNFILTLLVGCGFFIVLFALLTLAIIIFTDKHYNDKEENQDVKTDKE